MSLDSVLYFIGAVWAVSYVFKIGKALLSMFASGKNPSHYGEWAVVTGASEGIGKAYAAELYRKGMNVLLISRSQKKLDAAKKEIEEGDGKGEVQTLSADLTNPDAFEAVAAKIDSLGSIGVLVNNAGTSYDYPDYLLNVEDYKVDMLISLNITALTKMTKIVLKGMNERNSGAIINLASVSGTMPMGLLSVYSATKVYVDYFTQALAQEYPKLFIQVVSPHFVVTSMSKISRPSATVPTPENFAKQAVATIGKSAVTNGYSMHNITQAVIDFLPRWVMESYIFKMHKTIRRKAIKKKERKAKEAAAASKDQ